ncbi:DUF3575 domain-containing protein [Pontibacter roseus]|uniref:DUF3575 domain-containing protein n=1 Tax=Pontibacter roseus TaxID=336989 RepID=UPI0012FB3DA8|nr:DUF3575 domain-containing protein [Pontibacter roseus]
MKKILLLLGMLAACPAMAQVQSTESGTVTDTLSANPAAVIQPAANPVQPEVFRKNIVKINLSSLALNNTSLSYERSIRPKMSVVVDYRHMPVKSVVSAPLVKKALEKFWEEEDSEDLDAVFLGNNAYTGEIRFYAGDKPGARGLYLSLYGRYLHMKGAYHEYEYSSDVRTYILPFNLEMKGFGGGAMVGYQWLIAKRVTLDWYILGGHYGRLNVEAPALTNLRSMTSEERMGLKDDIESLNEEIPGVSLKATVTDEGVDVKGKAPFYGLRGLGFSLGVAF